MKTKLFVLLLILMSVNIYCQDNSLEIDEAGVVKVKEKLVKVDPNDPTKTTSYDPLPIGTILMFAGQDWEDNVTLEGWYACNKANENKPVNSTIIPNLEDRFIRGTKQSDVGTTGGNNSTKLTKEQLPPITATASTRAAFTPTGTTTSAGSHRHVMPYSDGQGSPSSTDYSASEYGAKNSTAFTEYAGAHTHTITMDKVPAYTPSITVNSAGRNQLIENRPAYYSVIYIIKVK